MAFKMVFKCQMTLMINDKPHQRGKVLVNEASIEEGVFFVQSRTRLMHLVY